MEIETRRLILREFRMDDWSAVFDYQSDPRYYSLTERAPAEAQEFVKMFLDQQQERPRRKFQLAATITSNVRLIDNCGIRIDTADAHQTNIGYEFSPEHWGKGYATEKAQAIVRFGFTTFGLHRIWSWCIANNRGSASVLEKLGMRLEGRLRENEYFKDRWWDTLMYGILESGWKTKQQDRT